MSGKANAAFVSGDESLSCSLNLPAQIIPIDFSNARKLPQLIAASAATTGALVVGTMIGWSSSVQTQLQKHDVTSNDNSDSIWLIQINKDQMSWISSLLNIGALLGSLFGGFVIDGIGRRRTFIALIPLYLIGWIFITLAVDKSMLYIGRIVGGVAAGLLTVTGPCYIGEISTPMMRGVAGMLFSLSISSGVLISSLLAWLDWRWTSGTLTILSLFCFPLVLLAPESPHYLVKNGRLEEARKALKWLRGTDYCDIETELNQIETKFKLHENQTIYLSDILRPTVYKPVLIGMGLMIFQQFSGFNVVFYYTVEIFRLAGSEFDPRIGSIIIKAVLVVVGALSSAVLVQRMKRRPLFILSELFSAFSIFVMGAYFYMQEANNTIHNLGWLPLASLVLFITSLGLGTIPLSWLMSYEILPARYKSPCSTVVTFTYWASAFIVTKTFENLEDTLTLAAPFWFYGCCTVLGVLFGVFLLPETKNKTPEQIQSLFETPLYKKFKISENILNIK